MRIINHLPNFITSLNILIGCTCLVFVFEGNILWASWMIFAATVLDFLDGLSARLFNAFSEFGKQLDSLSDMTVFGVVPAMVMFKMIGETEDNGVASLQPFVTFIIPVCAALRLARFNIDNGQRDKFSGLPTPAAALFFASLPVIITFDNSFFSEIIRNRSVLVFISIAISLLMVTPVELFSLKMKSFSWKGNELRYFFICCSIILIIALNAVAVPLTIILYIFLSLINNKLKIQS